MAEVAQANSTGSTQTTSTSRGISRRTFFTGALAVTGLTILSGLGLTGYEVYKHREFLKTANKNNPGIKVTLQKIRNILDVNVPTGISGTSAGSANPITLAASVEGEAILVPKGQLTGSTYLAPIATEDLRLAIHDGVDLQATALAASRQATGEKTGGASTIAQQLARHIDEATNKLWMEEKIFLSQGKTEQGKAKQLERKAMEMQVARVIVQEFPSWLDLTHAYLMVAPMGESKGFVAAALRHFKVDPSELKNNTKLKFEYICQLVGSLSNPNKYGPKETGSQTSKRDIIASNLKQNAEGIIQSIRGGAVQKLIYSIPVINHITRYLPFESGRGDGLQEGLFAEFIDDLNSKKLDIENTPPTNEVTGSKTYLAQFLQLVREPSGFYSKFTANDPKPDAFSQVETTLDPKIQEILADELARAKSDLKLEKCGGLVIDLEGNIKAFTGADTENPALAGIAAGSSLKPLIYALWMMMGEMTSTSSDSQQETPTDAPAPAKRSLQQTLLDEAITIDMPNGQLPYTPKNASKKGFTGEEQTLASHLVQSHNNAIAWLLKQEGMWDKLGEFMQAVGFDSWPGPEDGFKPAAALGASERGTNILEISRVLLSLLTSQIPDRLYAVNKITNTITGEQTIMSRKEIDISSFIDDKTGAEIMQTLEGVLKDPSGTAYAKMQKAKMDGEKAPFLAEKIKNMRIAAKTGSLPGDMGGLTVTFTPNGIFIMFGAGAADQEVWGSAMAQYAVRTAIKSVEHDNTLGGDSWRGQSFTPTATPQTTPSPKATPTPQQVNKNFDI